MLPAFFVFDGSIPKVLSFVKENFYSSHPTCFPHGFAPPPGQNLDAVPLAAWNAQPAQASSPRRSSGSLRATPVVFEAIYRAGTRSFVKDAKSLTRCPVGPSV